MVNRTTQSRIESLAIVKNKGKKTDYYPLFDRYRATGKADGFAGLLALLLIESLHKRIAYLTSRRIVPLSGWAKAAKQNASTVLNKAKRQTIPAFRVREKWMIDADYELPADHKDATLGGSGQDHRRDFRHHGEGLG